MPPVDAANVGRVTTPLTDYIYRITYTYDDTRRVPTFELGKRQPNQMYYATSHLGPARTCASKASRGTDSSAVPTRLDTKNDQFDTEHGRPLTVYTATRPHGPRRETRRPTVGNRPIERTAIFQNYTHRATILLERSCLCLQAFYQLTVTSFNRAVCLLLSCRSSFFFSAWLIRRMNRE